MIKLKIKFKFKLKLRDQKPGINFGRHSTWDKF